MPRRSAGKHAAPRSTSSRGARRAAETPTGGRHRAAARRPALAATAPRALGALAVAAAVAGAVGTHAPAADQPLSVAATSGSVLSLGTTATAEVQRAVRLDRAARPSRDSAREVLGRAAGKELRNPTTGQGRQRNGNLRELALDAEEAAREIAKDGWQLPLPAGSYRLTARFGECSGLWSHCHTGLDFAAPSGTPVAAVANGVVTETSYAGAYGNRAVMTLEDGTEIWYCHLTSFSAQAGETVVGGQPIGTVGSTGNSTGPHLHLEVRPGGGDAVDPYNALSVHGVRP